MRTKGRDLINSNPPRSRGSSGSSTQISRKHMYEIKLRTLEDGDIEASVVYPPTGKTYSIAVKPDKKELAIEMCVNAIALLEAGGDPDNSPLHDDPQDLGDRSGVQYQVVETQ